jgi:hypothetical protein
VAEEYYSFDKALAELKLRSEELKKLVSQGEIRAFRDKDTMRFRKEDIEVLARRRTTDGGEVIEDLVFADEDDTGMATAQISEEDTLLVEETEEVIELEAPATKARPTVQRTVSRTRQIQDAGEKKESTAFLVAAIATSVLLVYGLFVIQSVTATQSTGMTEWLANMFR